MSATPLLIPNRSERPPNEDFNYLSVIGSQNSTRLCLCSWQSSSIFIEPWQLTYQSCEWVVSYLYHTRNHAITYYKDCNAMPNEPTAWEASSHPLDWKRTPAERLIFWRWCSNQTEYIRRSFLNGGPISWFSQLQKLVALSTVESEIYAAIDEVKIIAHLKILLNELGARDLSPVTTYQNQACIQMGS